MSCSCA